MITLRPRATLHHVEGGWFSANWHFSFDTYNDPENTWFGDLRVFNDDRLVPGAVWPMHPHRDIEGVTYVAEGSFEHADSRGNGGILPPGSVQRATLGSGMQHSEGNHSQTEPMRFIQIWIIPRERGLEPSVEQREFPDAVRRGGWLPVLVPAPGLRRRRRPGEPRRGHGPPGRGDLRHPPRRGRIAYAIGSGTGSSATCSSSTVARWSRRRRRPAGSSTKAARPRSSASPS